MFLTRDELDEIQKGDYVITAQGNRYKIRKVNTTSFRTWEGKRISRGDGVVMPRKNRESDYIVKVERSAHATQE